MDLFLTFYLSILMSLDCSNVNSEPVLSPSSPLVTEFNPLTLSCKYIGYEVVHEVVWLRNLRVIATERPHYRSKYKFDYCAGLAYFKLDRNLYDYSCPSTNERVLTVKNITAANHGDEWSCDIYPKYHILRSNTVTIFVRVDVQLVTMTRPNEDVITVQEGGVVELSCETAFGRPKPDITWYKDEGTLDIYDDVKLIDNVTYQYIKHLNETDLYTTRSILLYTPTRFDHGMRVYCMANNTNETTVVSAKKPKLNVEYKPDAPSDFKFLSSCDIPILSWRSGSNGGRRQTFVIQTSRKDSNNWMNQTIVKETDDHYLNVSGMYGAVLSKIPPGQYDVRVIAENRIGKSEPMYLQQAIHINEKQESLREMKSDNTTLIVGIGLGLLNVALITYGIYMTVVLRRLKSKTESATGTDVHANDVGNESRLYMNTSGETSRRGATDDNLNPDVEQYVELDRVNLSDPTMYETIVKQ